MNIASHAVSILTLSLLFLFGCDPAASEADKTDPDATEAPVDMRPLTAQEQALVDGSNNFTFTILKQLAKGTPDQSFFASPLSISMAFGMALNGADGDTYAQMVEVLGHGGLSNDEINVAFRDLIALLTRLDPKVRMEIANSVWYRKGFDVLQDFLATNQEYFDAEIAALDFDDPDAPDIINAWINNRTDGLIPKMIDEIGDEMVLYLMNAIYFKGDWTLPFDPKETRSQTFTTTSGDPVDVPMMHLGGTFPYAQDEHWQVVDLTYGAEGDFSFTAFLPTDEENRSAFAGSLTRQKFESMTAQLAHNRVDVFLPRFEIDFEYDDLKADLQSMGLPLPFDPNQADFSRIHPSEELYISELMHRAVITVDEEGSEAAAATVIGIGITSMPPAIRMDRPFLFFIRETSSNTILFMGKYAGPTQ